MIESDFSTIQSRCKAEYVIPAIAVTAALISESLPVNFSLIIIEVVVALFLVQLRWPWGASFALFLAAALSGYAITVFNVTVRPEQVAVLVLLPGAMLRLRGGQWETSDTLLAGFIGIGFLSSAVSSSIPAASMRHATGQSLAIVSYWLARRLAKENGHILTVFLVIGTTGALFGILCYGFHHLLGTETGIMEYPATALRPELAAVQGSHVEANIFGSYTASFSAVLFFLYIKWGNRKHLIACIMSCAATAVSLARASWIGLALAVTFVVVSEMLGPLGRRLTVQTLVITLLVTAVGLSLWYSSGSLRERALSIAPDKISEDPTLVHRIYHATLAVDDFYVKPWLGQGTDSFELVRAEESEPDLKGAWISSLSVRILHDSGIIGVTLLFGFLFSLMWKAWRSREPIARALLAGSIVLMVAFQFSDATVLAYPWLLFGLMSAATSARCNGEARVTVFEARSRQH